MIFKFALRVIYLRRNSIANATKAVTILMFFLQLPEDVYKSHLESSRPAMSTATLDTMRMNLAASYVNGLTNCGFGKQELIKEDGKDGSWLTRQKELGNLSFID